MQKFRRRLDLVVTIEKILFIMIVIVTVILILELKDAGDFYSYNDITLSRN